MKAVREFTRFASSYAQYNVIQKYAAGYLVEWIGEKDIGTVLDVGCGEGELYRLLRARDIRFERFVALDLSEKMLELHPSGEEVRFVCADFDSENFGGIPSEIDTVLSSSALQWSRDLEGTLSRLSRFGHRAYLSLFTDGTFRTLLETAGIPPLVRSADEAERAMRHSYRLLRSERICCRLRFDSVREMFRYIKKSGVSGGKARLDYRSARRLMESYPLDYLEFELLFAVLEPRSSFSRA